MLSEDCVARNGQIDSQISKLGDAVDELDRSIGDIGDAISPIMRLEEPTSCPKEKAPDTLLVVLADRLRNITRTALRINEHVRSMIDRIEL